MEIFIQGRTLTETYRRALTGMKTRGHSCLFRLESKTKRMRHIIHAVPSAKTVNFAIFNLKTIKNFKK